MKKLERSNSAAALLFTGLMACGGGESAEEVYGEAWDDCSIQVDAAEGYAKQKDWIGRHPEQRMELLELKSRVQDCLVRMGISSEEADRLQVKVSQPDYVSMPICEWKVR